ncbi:MAG TPA: pyridoxamine 5'-phosphate oxidase [Gemmatimonadales bacterium]|nr:pyridoxamine 5'-phosphate oxidase [Gemmatimonadales bacterium]
MSIGDIRRDYARARLDEGDVAADPYTQFGRWFEDARRAELGDANAMVLATATPDGTPSARVVLLKGFDQGGFTFFTDYRSQKGRELAANPRAALVFYWRELERQVRIAGSVGRAPAAASDAYFRSRPRASRLSAWASHQSECVESRAALEARVRELDARYPGDDVPLPPYWGGFVVVPDRVEFWQGRENRLHDRINYTRTGGGWLTERLSP